MMHKNATNLKKNKTMALLDWSVALAPAVDVRLQQKFQTAEKPSSD